MAVTCRLGADPAARAQVGDVQDVNLFAWFMRYEATAIAHGRLPALTTAALNAPHGISMMWNTSVLLPGVLLAPVTLLAGPQTSLTLMLTLGFAGSAASLFVVLRRWGASLTAAAIGGAVYGFSPALLNSGIGHYNLQFAVLPPLIIDALLRIVTGRGSAVRTGAWLGVLAAAQLFTGEELLTDTALAGLVLVVVLVAGQPRAVRVKARHAGTGIATGVAVMLVICGHAMWAQFHGPLRQSYQPRFTHYTSYLSAHPAVFVTPAGNLLFHTPANAAAAARYPTHLPEYLAYLGWPLLVVLVAGAIRYWRHPRVRVMAVTFAVLELVSLGDSYRGVGPFLPWHWLQGLPVLGELIPDRLAILADGAAAAVLAFALDRARQAASPLNGAGGTERTWPPRSRCWRCCRSPRCPYAVAAPTPVPAGWQAAFARLRLAPDARVLVVPIPDEHFTQPMRWQADTAEPASMIGGYFLGPNQSGQTKVSPGLAGTDAQYLDPLWTGKAPSVHRSVAQLRADVAYWRPAAVIDVLHAALPARAGADRAVRPPSLQGRPAARLAALATWAR